MFILCADIPTTSQIVPLSLAEISLQYTLLRFLNQCFSRRVREFHIHESLLATHAHKSRCVLLEQVMIII